MARVSRHLANVIDVVDDRLQGQHFRRCLLSYPAGVQHPGVQRRAELEELAAIYSPGDELWRVELDHFSAHDVNWPGRGGDGDDDPAGGGDFPSGGPGCAMRGSIVLCDSRGIVEHVQVPGAPFSLVYRSDRAKARNHTLHIDLIPQDEPPNDLRGVELVVEVAGQRHEEIFEASPNLSTVFEWDGLDAFGREVTGRTQAIIRIAYLYQECYAEPAPLDEAFGAAASRSISVQPNGASFGVAGPCSSVDSRIPRFSEVVSTGFLGDTGVGRFPSGCLLGDLRLPGRHAGGGD